MRMQSVGKCSGSVVAGALLVFSLILLYNYWDVSTANRDLLLKLHTAEHQILTLAKANDALESSMDKVRVEKTRLDGSLQSQVQSRQRAEEELHQKEEIITKLSTQLTNEKEEIKTLRDQLVEVRHTIEEKDTELFTTKEKVLSLEAQLTEKETERERLEKALKTLEEQRSKFSSPIPPPATKLDDNLAQQQQPVLINDPAVPYPAGWMNKATAGKRESPYVTSSLIGNVGIQSHPGSRVIILDPPNSSRLQARFSVLDQPKPNSPYYRPLQAPPPAKLKKQQMNPELSQQPAPASAHHHAAAPAPAAVPIAISKDKEFENGGAGGEINGEGMGVLPVPGGGGNLDAAEEDGEQGVKGGEEGQQQDDQSPDGTLIGLKDSNKQEGVLPAPPQQEQQKQKQNLIQSNNNNEINQLLDKSGQDIREAAHLNHNSILK